MGNLIFGTMQSIEGSVQGVPTSGETKIVSSSCHSGPQSLQPVPLINYLSKTSMLVILFHAYHLLNVFPVLKSCFVSYLF